jgi:hypothetical protein
MIQRGADVMSYESYTELTSPVTTHNPIFTYSSGNINCTTLPINIFHMHGHGNLLQHTVWLILIAPIQRVVHHVVQTCSSYCTILWLHLFPYEKQLHHSRSSSISAWRGTAAPQVQLTPRKKKCKEGKIAIIMLLETCCTARISFAVFQLRTRKKYVRKSGEICCLSEGWTRPSWLNQSSCFSLKLCYFTTMYRLHVT